MEEISLSNTSNRVTADGHASSRFIVRKGQGGQGDRDTHYQRRSFIWCWRLYWKDVAYEQMDRKSIARRCRFKETQREDEKKVDTSITRGSAQDGY